MMIELFTREPDAINLPDDAGQQESMLIAKISKTELIDPAARIEVTEGVYEDIQEFIRRMKNERVDVKQLGLAARTMEEILKEIQQMYILPVSV